ncbi:hypothetical protein AVEN_23605-1 [Araneus ventricosus]|uniref:Uncharacterized protein n=1 Tax=Araneus ventricosus TaxID=182803 RepID=A0A4Y2BJK7_ARAVE|nr:hypothetical protein AVEN_23605-1 [Araneus ventricosus]
MRSVGVGIPLSSSDLKSSIPEKSSTPLPPDKELHTKFPTPTSEVEPTSRLLEPKPPTEQRFEPSTVHPNTAESVPTAVALRRSTRVKKAPDRLML